MKLLDQPTDFEFSRNCPYNRTDGAGVVIQRRPNQNPVYQETRVMAGVQRISAETREQVVSLYQSGKTTYQIASELLIGRRTCERILTRSGAKTRRQKHRDQVEGELARDVRKCLKCGEEKPLHAMVGNRKLPGGVAPLCRDCLSKKHGGRRYAPPSVSLTDVQCAYLAALVDGEGHVGLSKTRRNSARCYYTAVVTITMYGEALKSLRGECGFGSIFDVKRSHLGHKDLITWCWTANVCRSVLPKLLPFFRFKRRQAELLLEYLSSVDHLNRTDVEAMSLHLQNAEKTRSEIRSLNSGSWACVS